jgi:radical SAM-linked protein
MVRTRVRLRFAKQGDLRWIGHRDLARCFERWFRRSGLPLSMSEGFHPKPRISFPSALAVGIESVDEVLELELTEVRDAGQWLASLNPHAPSGLAIRSLEVMAPGAPKARVGHVRYQVPVPPERAAGVRERIERIRSCSSWPVQRPNRPEPVDLLRTLEEVLLAEGLLDMRLRVQPQASAGPREVLGALGLADLERDGVVLTRTAVELAP